MVRMFVTTMDNPYDYFTQFDDWYAFDTQKGYNTCAYMARIAMASNEMSERDYIEAVNDAVEEILRLNVLGIYKKVVENDSVDESEDEKETNKREENEENSLEQEEVAQKDSES